MVTREIRVQKAVKEMMDQKVNQVKRSASRDPKVRRGQKEQCNLQLKVQKENQEKGRKENPMS
jgi:hypothetical protein